MSPQEYIQRFYAGVGQWESKQILERHTHPARSATRASQHTVYAQAPLDFPQLQHIAVGNVSDETALIVENIDLTWIAAIGDRFDVEPAFFVEHAAAISGTCPEKAIIGQWSAHRKKPVHTLSSLESWHIDGVTELGCARSTSPRDILEHNNALPRIAAFEQRRGWRVATRVSCCFLQPKLCMRTMALHDSC